MLLIASASSIMMSFSWCFSGWRERWFTDRRSGTRSSGATLFDSFVRFAGVEGLVSSVVGGNFRSCFSNACLVGAFFLLNPMAKLQRHCKFILLSIRLAAPNVRVVVRAASQVRQGLFNGVVVVVFKSLKIHQSFREVYFKVFSSGTLIGVDSSLRRRD